MSKYFNNLNDVNQVKQEYRRLCKMHHPDIGGCEETIKAINNEYDLKLKSLDGTQFRAGSRYCKDTKTYKDHFETYKYNPIIEQDLMVKIRAYHNLRLPNSVHCDLRGTWLWVSGQVDGVTKQRLEFIGFKEHLAKKEFYYRNDLVKMHGFKGKFTSTNRVKAKYGSVNVGNSANDSQSYLGR